MSREQIMESLPLVDAQACRQMITPELTAALRRKAAARLNAEESAAAINAAAEEARRVGGQSSGHLGEFSLHTLAQTSSGRRVRLWAVTYSPRNQHRTPDCPALPYPSRAESFALATIILWRCLPATWLRAIAYLRERRRNTAILGRHHIPQAARAPVNRP